MKRKIIFGLIALFSEKLMAQDSLVALSDSSNIPLVYRIEPGVIFGGDYVNNGILVSFIPYFTFDIKPRIQVGASPNISYFTTLNGGYTETLYGGSLYAKGYVSKSFYGQIEYELLSRKFVNGFPNTSSSRRWIDHPMIGGGYRKELMFGYYFISGLYIFNYKSYESPYARPIILRAGVGIRLNSSVF